MAHAADDLVLRPRMFFGHRKVRERARMERVLDAAKRRGGGLLRTVRRRIAGTVLSEARAATGVLARGAGGWGAAGRTVARGGPIAAIVAALVVATVVATRLISGRSFENIGENVKHVMLGDMPEEAMASHDAREALAGNQDVARIIGIEGGVNSQIAQVYAALRRQNLNRRMGGKLFMMDERYQSNDLLDMLILRARDFLIAGWRSCGGPDSVDRLSRKLAVSRGTSKGFGGSWRR